MVYSGTMKFRIVKGSDMNDEERKAWHEVVTKLSNAAMMTVQPAAFDSMSITSNCLDFELVYNYYNRDLFESKGVKAVINNLKLSGKNSLSRIKPERSFDKLWTKFCKKFGCCVERTVSDDDDMDTYFFEFNKDGFKQGVKTTEEYFDTIEENDE